MKKILSAVVVAGVLAIGGAFAQVNTSSLQVQVQTVAKLVSLTETNAATRSNNVIADYPYLFSKDQVNALLPYLREVRALPSLTADDVAFYSAKIAAILTDAQRKEAGSSSQVLAAGSSTPAISGSGSGGSSSSAGFTTFAVNPMILDAQSSDLDKAILSLTAIQNNFSE